MFIDRHFSPKSLFLKLKTLFFLKSWISNSKIILYYNIFFSICFLVFGRNRNYIYSPAPHYSQNNKIRTDDTKIRKSKQKKLEVRKLTIYIQKHIVIKFIFVVPSAYKINLFFRAEQTIARRRRTLSVSLLFCYCYPVFCFHKKANSSENEFFHLHSW